MGSFRYEIHCHTKQGSKCGMLSGGEVAKKYAELGYTGIIITDHFFNGNCAISPELPWAERVERFFDGYEDAKQIGRQLGLSVFYGWEYNYLTTEFLTYGLDKKWLLNNPDILDIPPEEYCDRVHRDGGFIVHAHPFRERPYISYIRLFPHYVDAVETTNAGHHMFPDFDKRADFYADTYQLKKLAGSDMHFEWPGGYCAVEFDTKLESTKDFTQLVTAGKARNLRIDVNGNVLAYLG